MTGPFTRPMWPTAPSLALEDLEAAVRAIDELDPPWVRMVRKAERVEVKATEHLASDEFAYVIDPNVTIGQFAPPGPYPVMVVCRPEHEAEVRNAVALIRREPAG